MKTFKQIFFLVGNTPHVALKKNGKSWMPCTFPAFNGQKWWSENSYTLHSWNLVKKTPTLDPDTELFPWHSLPPLTEEHEVVVRESLRALAYLSGRQWVCSITGCKQSSTKFSAEVEKAARLAGQICANFGLAVLTGGLSGVMSAAAEGARLESGHTIGLLPTTEHADANPFFDLVLPTGLGYARNYLIATSCDLMIALPGGNGTITEMCFAEDFAREVISWGGPETEKTKRIPLGDEILLKEKITEILKNKLEKLFL